MLAEEHSEHLLATTGKIVGDTYRKDMIRVNEYSSIIKSLEMEPCCPSHLARRPIVIDVIALSIEHHLVGVTRAKREDLDNIVLSGCLTLPGAEVYLRYFCPGAGNQYCLSRITDGSILTGATLNISCCLFHDTIFCETIGPRFCILFIVGEGVETLKGHTQKSAPQVLQVSDSLESSVYVR